MKTKKQVKEQRARIEQHQADGMTELPDIGERYQWALQDAQRENLAWQLASEKWMADHQHLIPICATLTEMGLIDAKYRLTKLGRHYISNFGYRPRGYKPRPQK